MPGQKALDELKELHREFLGLGTSVEELVAGAASAGRGAGGPSGLTEDELEESARQIAERCRRVALLYQPVAIDFREVTSVLRATAELEHIGHLALEITGWVTHGTQPAPAELVRLAEVVSGMVRRFLDAYTLLDVESVRPVPRLRDEVNSLARVLTDRLISTMRADPTAVEPGLKLFAGAQNFQRIAEHAVALAEEVTFLTLATSRTRARSTGMEPRGIRNGIRDGSGTPDRSHPRSAIHREPGS
jgi:phosphate transport system protein